jgi:5-methylcytosine-specific restriction endonuclease McrA
MLTVEIFKERVTRLWDSQKRMAAPKKFSPWAKRAGMIRRPAQPILFTRKDLEVWLWKRVGLNAIQCPYCKAPIDIMNLTLDHIVPRTAGGQFAIENMQETCADCNQRKGQLSHDAFARLLRFAESELSPYDQTVLLKRLKAAHHGAPERFNRHKAASKPQPPAPPANTPGLDFSGLGNF